ncbi:hypothetical protein CH75_10280 [Dyella jiangningensis]|nr:hypothetical protein CH75_10280 [Dyella jiangningensis]
MTYVAIPFTHRPIASPCLTTLSSKPAFITSMPAGSRGAFATPRFSARWAPCIPAKPCASSMTITRCH